MSRPYLEVTYRNGKPFAAYLYLQRKPGDSVERTESRGNFLIDVSKDGRVLGLEFTNPSGVQIAEVNAALAELHQAAVTGDDLRPLSAA